ncbi:lysophospholipid acyltransferase family protein [Trichloromonas sp.]|uniref:lysophospholipid acyltransferase family protein n=1 Tax=Trichloromonas sp. TaxID=3069249 RepID=UPI003D814112
MRISWLRRAWVTFSAYIIGFYASLLNRFQVVGDDNIPRSGGVLLASNHISGYETVFLPWAVARRYPFQMLWAPAKEELFKNPILSWLFQSWGAFPVRRRRDVRAGKTLNDLLQTEKVMLFPEGTRHRDGKLGPGNRGVGKTIYESRPQVVPAALSGLNHWKFPGFGQHAKVVFGKPIDFSDLYELEDCKETHLRIVQRVMSSIGELLES